MVPKVLTNPGQILLNRKSRLYQDGPRTQAGLHEKEGRGKGTRRNNNFLRRMRDLWHPVAKVGNTIRSFVVINENLGTKRKFHVEDSSLQLSEMNPRTF